VKTLSGPSETLRFPVEGMVCGSCVGRITRALRQLPGVAQVKVDLNRATVTVRREPALVSSAALAAAIAKAGYRANLDVTEVLPIIDRPGPLNRLLRRRTE
jgi:P-type Cu+ transporter